jgi:hypothetical protein
MALHTGTLLPSRMKKQKYNPVCVEDEESISDMLSEELHIDSDDEMNLENEGQSSSEESSNASSKSECESETSVVRVDGWEDMTRNPGYTHLLKIQGHNLTYQVQSPWIILDYFSMMSY